MSTQELSPTRRRTLDALVSAARDLVASGVTPTVEEAAERAGVSRTTAYRYFPDRTALLASAHPETAMTSLLDDTASDDPVERVEQVLDRFLPRLLETEAQQRTMLRLSLDPDLDDERRSSLPLRQGRVIGWLEEALEPLGLADDVRRRVAVAMRSAAGIESLVWLVDVAGLTSEEAAAQLRWSARAILAEVMRSGPPAPAEG